MTMDEDVASTQATVEGIEGGRGEEEGVGAAKKR
jgi:hypothetical protein